MKKTKSKAKSKEKLQAKPKMQLEPNEKQLLTDIDTLSKCMQKCLPRKTSRESVSMESKSALKVRIIQASLLHRGYELTEVATELYKSGKLVAGIVVARAAFETATLLSYMYYKLNDVVKTRVIGDIDEYLMKIMFGKKRKIAGANHNIEAINILTAVDKLDKELPKGESIRSFYDDLCEYTHPNYMGTVGSYADEDKAPFSMTFGQRVKKSELIFVLNVVYITLEIFTEYNRNLENIFPEFIKLHEAYK